MTFELFLVKYTEMEIFGDYKLSRESEIKIGKLVDKWNKESDKTNITVRPWDWMFNRKESENEEGKTVINIKEITVSQENKRKVDELIIDTEVELTQANPKKKCSLSPNQQSQFLALKRGLHEPENTTCFQTLLQFFTEMSIAEIEMLCDEISISELSYDKLASLSQFLISTDESISFSVMTVLFKNMYIEKVVSLSNIPSQIFKETFLTLSKKYPRSSCDGVAVNLIKLCLQLNDHQLNLLTFLTQQSYPAEVNCLFFQEFIKLTSSWNENLIQLAQQMINLKLPFGPDVLEVTVETLEKESKILPKNLKFARLLQSFLNIYANKLQRNDLLKLHKIILSNETLLKRQLLSAVTKFVS